MSFTVPMLVVMLVIGAVAGWLGGVIARGRGFGLVGNMIIGIIGAFLGTFLLGFFGILATTLLGQALIATGGAIVLVYLLGLIKR